MTRYPVTGPIASRLGKIGLGTALALLLGVIIAGTVGAVGYLSFRNGQQGVNELVAQLQSSLQARIKQNLDEFLSKPHALNRINAEALQSGLVAPHDFVALRKRFLQQVRAFDSVVACAFGSAEGDFIGAGWRNETSFDSAIADKAVDNDYRVFILDERGEHGDLVSTINDYDPRARSWYRTAVEAGRPTWSPIYVWASRSNIGISAVEPVYGEANALLGVQQSALSLEHIGRFLVGLQIGKTGQAFIMERSGLLVASSFVEPVARQGSGGEGAAASRFQATESSSPLIRSSAISLSNRYEDLRRIAGDERMRVTLESGDCFLNVLPYSDGRGLEWIVAVVVPVTDFMAHVNENARLTVFLSLGALAVAVLLGFLGARWVTQPLLRLNLAAQEVSRGQWQSMPAVQPFRELGELAASFNRMGERLRGSFEVLENRVEERTRELASANEQLQADIAKRERVERALRQSEETYRHIVEHAIEGIFQSTPEGRLLSVNPAFVRVFGFDSPQQMMGEVQNIAEQLYVHPEDRSRFMNLMSREDRILGFEAEMHKRSGETFWMFLNSRCVRAPNGKVLYYDGFMSDITDRKRAENAVKLHLSVMETVAEGIFLIGVQDNLIKWTNRKLEEMFGYGPGEMIGMHVDRVNAPTEKTPTETRISIVDLLLETGEWHGEIKSVRKDGAQFWCHIHVSLFDHPEFGQVMVSAHTNITDRKQAEEALRNKEATQRGILDAANESIWLFTPDGFVITANEMALRRYNKPAEAVIGKHYNELLRTELARSRLARLKETVDSGRVVEFEDEREGISYRHTLYPVLDDGKRVTSVVCFSRDITERKRVEEERLRLEERLQQTQKAESLGRMAGSIAHNFNNLLAAVLGNLELALDDAPVGSKLGTHITEAMKASHRAAEISRFMLTYVGQAAGRAASIDPVPVLRDACAIFDTTLPANVSLKSELIPLGCLVRADGTHLTQIVTNLVSNSAEAIGQRDGEISVALHALTGADIEESRLYPPGWEPDAREYVCLTVVDNGCGMDEATLDKIFDPFFSTKFTGRGMGLSVVLGLVRGLNGAISVRSRPGEGATFKAFVPVLDGDHPFR